MSLTGRLVRRTEEIVSTGMVFLNHGMVFLNHVVVA